LIHAIVHPADIQDSGGGILPLRALFGCWPFLQVLFADRGYAGSVFAKAVVNFIKALKVEVVKRSDGAKDFEVLTRRWAGLRMQPAEGHCHLASGRHPPKLKKLCNHS
jgi:hypothetical protein